MSGSEILALRFRQYFAPGTPSPANSRNEDQIVPIQFIRWQQWPKPGQCESDCARNLWGRTDEMKPVIATATISCVECLNGPGQIQQMNTRRQNENDSSFGRLHFVSCPINNMAFVAIK